MIARTPPLIMEDLLSSSELDSPSSANQSPRSHIEFVWTIDNSSLPENSFTEGFLPHFNPPLMNLLEPVLDPTVPVLPAPVAGTFPSISPMTNGSWVLRDTFCPPPLP